MVAYHNIMNCYFMFTVIILNLMKENAFRTHKVRWSSSAAGILDGFQLEQDN